ncbi:hypothetical protein ACHAXS_013637 [Conticribra weissflogii]
MEMNSSKCGAHDVQNQYNRRSITSGAALLVSYFALLHTADGFTTPNAQSSSRWTPLCARLHDEQPRLIRKKVVAMKNGKSASSKSVLNPPRSLSRSNNANIADGPLSRLSHDEELCLLRQMRSHPPDSPISQMARQTLLIHNLPLVKSIVTKILRARPHLRKMIRSATEIRGNAGVLNASSLLMRASATESQVGAALTRDDLLNEGTIGLAEAIDRYDFAYSNVKTNEENSSHSQPSDIEINSNKVPKGARLGTYATYWIRARILRAILNREHAFRFPERTLLASYRLVKAAKQLGLEWAAVEDLRDDEHLAIPKGSKEQQQRQELRTSLLKAAGIASESLFREAIRVRTVCKSGIPAPLESWMSPALNSSEQEENYFMSDSDPQHIRDTLSKFLVPREVEVLSLRYGLVNPFEDVSVDGSTGEVGLSGKEQPEIRLFRDYQAEAEEELFGPSGILSHYSTEPSQITFEDITSFQSTAAVNSITKNSNKLNSVAEGKSNRGPVEKSKALPSFPSSTLLSYKEIGKQMTLSAEYCRRLCTAALQKLARAAEEGRLAESDFSLGW